MKEGKSEVMCEQGQLYKVSKNKDGVVTKEKLTKHWTDWVDYWAVDFDYASRKEIIKVPVGTGISGATRSPASSLRKASWRCRNSRNGGPAATSSKTNGRASARARAATSS